MFTAVLAAAAIGLSGLAVPGHHHTLQQLMRESFASWEAGDAKRYANTYTEDASVVIFNGDPIIGRAAVERRFEEFFRTYLKNTRLDGDPDEGVKRFRHVTKDVAILVSQGCVLREHEETCPADAYSTQTNVAVKRNGKWLFTAFQNTRVTPLGVTQ